MYPPVVCTTPLGLDYVRSKPGHLCSGGGGKPTTPASAWAVGGAACAAAAAISHGDTVLPCNVEKVAGSSGAAAARVTVPTANVARTTAAIAAQQQVLVRDGRRGLRPRLDGQGGGLSVGMLIRRLPEVRGHGAWSWVGCSGDQPERCF